MGSRVVNSCPLPAFDTGIDEQQAAETTQVGESCPIAESKPDLGPEANDQNTGPSCSATSNLQPFPMTDPLIKSAIGPLLDGRDPKLLAYARQVAEQQDEPADEKAVRAALGEDGVRQFKDMKNDLAEAHRVFEATGHIPQTKHPFAWIEIQTGKMMTQSERYDAFMTKIGKNPRDVAFYENNINIDPVYITPEEFHAQHKARIADVQRELHDECHTGAMRFQPLARPDCERKILERNTNPQYVAERDEVHRKDREFYQKSNEHTEAVVNSGPLALVGRAGGRMAGYGIGLATGGTERAEKWADKGEEWGAVVTGPADGFTQAYGSARGEIYHPSSVYHDSVVEMVPPGPKNEARTQPSHPAQEGATPSPSAHEPTPSQPNSHASGDSAAGATGRAAAADGTPPVDPPKSPSSAPRTMVDTNTAIGLDNARQKEAKGEKLTSSERRVFEEFKGKDVWVPHAADTEVGAGGGTKEAFKVATDVTPSTKEERATILNDLQSASVGGGDKKGEKDRMLVRQVLLTPAPSGKTNTFSTADNSMINGLFRLAQIPDPRPGHAGEVLDPAKLGKSVPDFLHDVLKKDTFDVTVQGHRLTVRPL